MWKYSIIIKLSIIISTSLVNAADSDSIREVSLDCVLRNISSEEFKLFNCGLVNISSPKDQPKVISSNLDIKNITKFFSGMINVDIYGDENYPEKFPENLGKTISGTSGLTYTNTPLKFICRDDFKDMEPNLFMINLGNNKIEEIPFDTFYDLSSLRTLYINNNNLKALAPNLFANAPDFKLLSVNNNDIEELHPDLFKNCTIFMYILAQSNKIVDVHEDLFKNNPNLTFVIMPHNRIKNIAVDFTTYKNLYLANFVRNYGTCDIMFDKNDASDVKDQPKEIQSILAFQQKIEEVCRNS